jgi:hypothetical protein
VNRYQYEFRKTDRERYTKQVSGFPVVREGHVQADSAILACAKLAEDLGVKTCITPNEDYADALLREASDGTINLTCNVGIVLGEGWDPAWRAWHLGAHVVLVRPAREEKEGK